MIIKEKLTAEDFENIKSNQELLAKIKEKDISYDKVIDALSYNNELRLLQIELVKLQRD